MPHFMMKSKEKGRRSGDLQSIRINGEGPNLILLAGGALLTTLIVKLGFRLNRFFHSKIPNENNPSPQEINDSNKEVNADVIWSTSISSDSLSESGSEIYVQRQVIQKLRGQLQRRDDMILEMQSRIIELRNSMDFQTEHSSDLETQIECMNRELFDSDREIQRLRKAIAVHCVGFDEEEVMEGKMEMMKKEIVELKEVIDGKDFLIKSYKEQKRELSEKIKDLQVKLDSRVPDIL